MNHPLIEALEKAGVTVVLMPPDNVKLQPGPSIAPQEVILPLVKEAKRRKPEILETLRRQEFNRLYALVRASMSRVAEIYIEGGIEEAKRQGMWPKILCLEHSIDQALVDLDEARLLGALEALERTWQEVTDKTAQRRRQTPPTRLEATA